LKQESVSDMETPINFNLDLDLKMESFAIIGESTLNELLIEALESKASDVHLTVALPPMMRVNGDLVPMREYVLNPDHTERLCMSMLNHKQKEELNAKGEVDFSYQIPNVSRFRVNVYRQRKSFGAAIRIIMTTIPTITSLKLPLILEDLALKPRGLILVTGPTGSGKSTTLAAMVDHINSTRSCHILTLEEPIEYLHKHRKCMINQREIGDDSLSFSNGLRSALREDPDVILVGEMRDLETISTAISAAETGHLVMSTLHTTSAAQTIDRIIDVFPPYQQTQIRVQLAGVIQGIIAQQLLITADGNGRVAALEILLGTDAVRNTIREGKVHQIQTYIQTGIKQGMMSMDYSLSQLVRQSRISNDTAYSFCQDPEMLQRYLISDSAMF
jgi:twitching motility protein PilT